MSTSPRPRPDLAPTSGATSPGDLAPRPPLLRRGAKSRGELDTPTNNHTTSPQGRSQELGNFDRREIVSPGRLNDVVTKLDDQERGWPPAQNPHQELVRSFIRAGLCPWCAGTRPGRTGPWSSIAAHVAKAHGVDRFQLREVAGLYRRSSICSDGHRLRCQARAIAESRVPKGSSKGFKKTLSSAGRALQRKRATAQPPEKRSENARKAAAAVTREGRAKAAKASGVASKTEAARRPIEHGTGRMYNHGCTCDLCRQYRRWVRGRDAKPTPVPGVRPCHDGCTMCAEQSETQ